MVTEVVDENSIGSQESTERYVPRTETEQVEYSDRSIGVNDNDSRDESRHNLSSPDE